MPGYHVAQRIVFKSPRILRNTQSIILLMFILANHVQSQSLELQYDLRHSIDPQNNRSNYPSLFFEFFKLVDSGTFFVKTQADFYGEHHNIGQLYLQLFREFKFWDPLIFLHLEYNGGVGIAEGTSHGYYVNNAFLLGLSIPFNWVAIGKAFRCAIDTTHSTSQATMCSFLFTGQNTFGKTDSPSLATSCCSQRTRIKVIHPL
jgi:hypothetical protein